MNSLDLSIIALILLLALLGYAQGFIIGAASLFGFALGGLVGTRLTRVLIERWADNPDASSWAPVIGIGVGLLITIVGAMAMQDLGSVVRVRIRTGEAAALDHLAGALLLVVVGLLLVWFAAASAIGMPQVRSYRDSIVQSRIVRQLNAVLPPAAPLLGAIASYDPFPTFDGGAIIADAPDPELPADPEVRAAARSVVRVVGTACGYQVTGTGWVAARGYVVTNAHVVAGEADTGVQPEGKGDPIEADVVHFDPVNDLAVLRVPKLDRPPLRVLGRVRGGTSSVVLGYPEQQGFTAVAARYDEQRRVRGDDIYGRGGVTREVATFRGLVRHGNSGGPLVDGNGAVAATVFASTVGERIRGGYGVPNEIAKAALADGQRVPSNLEVRTGGCID